MKRVAAVILFIIVIGIALQLTHPNTTNANTTVATVEKHG